jgi:uncharacterized protein DUF6165/glycosyl transferase family 25
MKTHDARLAVTSVLIDAAPADLLDRITVLEIKSERLEADRALRNVHAELTSLHAAREQWIPASPELERLAAELRKVNETLWDLEEAVRRSEADRDFGAQFVQSARSIIHANDRRAALKQAINRMLGASFQEEKSFALPDSVLGSGPPSGPANISGPFEFFDAIYCINLDSRPDRWQEATREFTAIGIMDRVERVAGIRHANPLEGCRLSHLECVRRASAAGAEIALIFEDDVTMPGFSPELLAQALDQLRAVPDWELFFLGGRVWTRPAERYENLFRARITQSHAYAIHRRAFAKVERSYPSIDVFYANNLKSYCVLPMLAWQRDGFSDTQRASMSRASVANREYSRLVLAPNYEGAVREVLERRLRGHMLRLQIQRYISRQLNRLASRLGFIRGRPERRRSALKPKRSRNESE